MTATQDFRDGAATGARLMSSRLIKLSNWGVRIDSEVLHALASGVRTEYGGIVDEEAVKEPS